MSGPNSKRTDVSAIMRLWRGIAKPDFGAPACSQNDSGHGRILKTASAKPRHPSQVSFTPESGVKTGGFC